MLKIDFIDESVDIDIVKNKDVADYIGSVRIPLKEMLQNENFAAIFPVLNHRNKEMGRVEIQLTFINSNTY